MNWRGVGFLLVHARDLVARGWCNHGPAKYANGSPCLDPISPAAVAWSPIGALMAAAHRYNQPWERVTEGTRDASGHVTSGTALFGALDAIREAAGLSTRTAMLKAIADWNDALEDDGDGTAAQKCLRILNRAVEPFEAGALFARAAGDR